MSQNAAQGRLKLAVAPPRHITVLLVEGFSQLAFACALEPLRIANWVSKETLYTWSLMSIDGLPVRCSNGSEQVVETSGPTPADCDALYVLSGLDPWTQTSPALLSYLRREARRGTPMGALCSGAYLLAAAGLLTGHPAALHWAYHDSFVESFPEVDLRRSVFVTDAPVVTASGGTAAADLMIHLIAVQHGDALSLAVADHMVYSAVRSPASDQCVSLQSRHGIRSEALMTAIGMMEASIEEPWPLTTIAAAVDLSPRQLERLFGQHVNCSPGKYFMDLRLQKAHNLICQTELSMTDIALACGFKSPAHFSRAYRTRYDMTPRTQRHTPGTS